MKTRLMVVSAAAVLESLLAPIEARAADERAFPVMPPVAYVSGDTWDAGGRRFRLYGVQSCIRGTTYEMADGARGDCGLASLRMLAGLVETLRVSCTPITTGLDGATIVVCAGQSNDKPVDLGAALIVSGYAFAAETPDGRPVNDGYFAGERTAERAHAGLWAARSFPHPVRLLRDGAAAPVAK